MVGEEAVRVMVISRRECRGWRGCDGGFGWGSELNLTPGDGRIFLIGGKAELTLVGGLGGLW